MIAALGIDLGTEYCRLVAADLDGRPHPVASQQAQQYRTPAAIGYEQGWVWGWSALGQAQDVVWDLREHLAGGLTRDFGGNTYEAQDLITEFFRRVHWGLPEIPHPSRGGRIVLTVPYSFGFRERRLLRDAVANAGFAVSALINDAEAAILGCEMEKALADFDDRPARVLLFDVGARRTALSLLEVSLHNRNLQVDLLMHDDQAPGLRSVQEQMLPAALASLDPKRPAALCAETFCGLLAQAANHGVDVTLETAGQSYAITAASVAAALQEWRMKADAGLRRLFAGAGLQPQDVDLAVPVGGGCELAEVRQTIAHFPAIIEPPAGARYDSLVAIGAARQAWASSEASRTPRLETAQTPAIGLELADGAFHPILDLNHREGVRDFRVYAAPDGQPLTIKLSQGFAQRALGNVPLAEEALTVQPQADGLVEVAARRTGDESVTLSLIGRDTVERTLPLR